MESARDITILKDEKSEFPILCETCLGPNPLIRMMKQNMGKECKVCERPFTIFRWKPGPKSRYKQTIICQICAKIKNLCQTCLFDLQYGLPIQVRDKFMNNPIELPDSNKNLIYKLNNIQTNNEPQIDPHNEEILKRISRVAPYYRRNKPRLCTFWIRGICNRGEECPYSHEQDSFDPSLSKQNILGRYKGKNDPLALKIFKQLELERDNERDKEKENEKGSEMEYPSMNPTEAIKRLN
ncbi:uncharacterized protein TA15655 [Theileria annulata]|uniref:C3H1-type domain-containing protein n=1 Tax=Theileria annulata TaxID=5874 RepID=Q4UFL8_THEAN|nr:uncharacterized protein TA15655 [Theileria annulata]CAI74098.1 hypothetical protein, conserved [Theileria annulata]|eukprot:XP_951830.1 hypothetical protein, conserved [Theileria annulata]